MKQDEIQEGDSFYYTFGLDLYKGICTKKTDRNDAFLIYTTEHPFGLTNIQCYLDKEQAIKALTKFRKQHVQGLKNHMIWAKECYEEGLAMLKKPIEIEENIK